MAIYTSSTPKVSTPVISPAAGTYNQPHQVIISTNTPGATIRYRTDGRAPSFFYPGTEYTGPITLDPGTYEITARGYKDGYYKSDVAESGEIVVNALTLPTPTIYPNGGNFNGSVTVYIGSTVLGAQIRYTIDGSTPTESSPQFAEPLYLGTTATVKARVFLDGYTPSDVVEKIFSVTQQANTPTIDPNGGEHTGSVQVTLNTTTTGATIRYTTNGAEPTSYSTAYSGPFTLGTGQHTVKAKAFLAGAAPSTTASADFTVYDPAPTVADPTMTPFSTQYFVEPFTITMHTDTEGAIIRFAFSTDGSIAPDPTESGAGGATYTGPFQISTNGQYRFKVRAYKGGGQSNITPSGTLSLGDALGASNTPVMTPPGGTYHNAVQVTLDANQPGAIFYTSDGSEPVSVPPATAPSQQYLSAISVTGSTTLKAKAYRPFFASGVTAEESYVFQCATPQITPGGIYTETANVEMSTATSGADIRYTTDGSEPTASSAAYSAPIALGIGAHTVQARCFKNNYEASDIATQVFVVKAAAVAPKNVVAQRSDRGCGRGCVSFTVDYTGSPAPDIQCSSTADIGGETEPVLEIPAAQAPYAGEYRAILSNPGGAVTTTVASLAVSSAAISGLTTDTSSPTPLGNLPTSRPASTPAAT
ncbi:MAG: chitobiase/beta-hexosaminidase C-terminal domain-containing protein [Caldilineaceae bacterium]